MKSILKLALISLTVISLTFANNSLLSKNKIQLSRDIIQAAQKTAARKKGCTPGVTQLINIQMKDVTVNTLRQFFNNFNLEDVGFIFEASFEKFVSKEDPTSDDIELFEYLNELLNKKRFSQISNFITNIQKLKHSTDARETLTTMKNELEKLYNALSQSKNTEEIKIAKKIRTDINAMIDQKGKIAVGNIICKKAKNNKK